MRWMQSSCAAYMRNIENRTKEINNFEYLFELENHNEKLFQKIFLNIRHAMQLCYDFLRIFASLYFSCANVSPVIKHKLRASRDITEMQGNSCRIEQGKKNIKEIK